MIASLKDIRAGERLVLGQEAVIGKAGPLPSGFYDPFDRSSANGPQPLVVGFGSPLLFEKSQVVLYGASGCFKSTIAIDLAMSVAFNRPFLGHCKVVESGPVIYAAREGEEGFGKRIAACRQIKGIHSNQERRMFLGYSAVLSFGNGTEVDKFCQLAEQVFPNERIKLVVIDTLSKSAAGNPDTNEGMSHFVEDTIKVSERLGCCVLIVHHTGHGAVKHPRGGSSLTCSIDTQISVDRKDKELKVTLSCQKQKEFAEFPKLVVDIEEVLVDGWEFSSEIARREVKNSNSAMVCKQEIGFVASEPEESQSELRKRKRALIEMELLKEKKLVGPNHFFKQDEMAKRMLRNLGKAGVQVSLTTVKNVLREWEKEGQIINRKEGWHVGYVFA